MRRTLTKKAPGISFGKPELKTRKHTVNKIIGEIINFKIEIDIDSLLKTFLYKKRKNNSRCK